MADKKLNELSTSSSADYIYAQVGDGSSATQVRISKADLASVLAGQSGMSGTFAAKTEVPETGGIYESVDLGLPSGTKWARMNVGATSETEHGDLFAWGATKPYRTGVDNTSNYSASKANSIQRDLKDNEDAATINMGSDWHLPTKDQFNELITYTEPEWCQIGSVWGRKYMKKSDHSVYVFFPASGYYGGASVNDRGSYGYYWTRSFNSSLHAWALYFDSSVQSPYANNRYYGFSVRGVRQ